MCKSDDKWGMFLNPACNKSWFREKRIFKLSTMIICQKVNATAHCVLESGKKWIAGEALLAQHDVKTHISLCVLERGGVEWRSVTVQHTRETTLEIDDKGRRLRKLDIVYVFFSTCSWLVNELKVCSSSKQRFFQHNICVFCSRKLSN